MAGSTQPWSLRRRTTNSLVGMLALLVVLIVLVSLSLYQTKRTGDDVVRRWDPAYLASQQALSAMVNQETGLRGFALGRDEKFLEPFTAYVGPEHDARRTLRRLLRGDDELLDMLDQYGVAVETWRSAVADPVIRRVRDGQSTQDNVVGSSGAKDYFDRIRAVSAQLTDAIDHRRQDALVAREHAFTLVFTAASLGVVLVLLAGLVLWRGLRRSVLAPIDDLAAQTRVVAGGDLDRHLQQSGPAEIVALGQDVEIMRGRMAEQIRTMALARTRIERRTAELARSNADLEQFAYVASHDLSEPLRKVTNFCQLLERQYADELDDKARRYIGFMVDGAKRMQILINDLLSFSRVGRTREHFQDVDLDQLLTQVLANLDDVIAQAGVEIVRQPLPTLPADPTLMTALLQNLVGNGVKYRSDDRPQRISISSERQGEEWQITIDDTGIGIDPQYAERIFTIFQRLHVRDQYGGTGIGLALCRKIVDFHGGRIWLAEKPEAGARFHLTLPLAHAPLEEMDDDELAALVGT